MAGEVKETESGETTESTHVQGHPDSDESGTSFFGEEKAAQNNQFGPGTPNKLTSWRK